MVIQIAGDDSVRHLEFLEQEMTEYVHRITREFVARKEGELAAQMREQSRD